MIPKDRALKIIIVISIVITILLPVINIYFVYPLFSKLLIDYTEEEATRTANHLESMLLSNVPDISRENLPANINAMVKQTQYHFDYIKLKLFSKEGEIIYSTDPVEIGKVNSKSFFHEIVAKGENHSKVVQKDKKFLIGQAVKSDVVETYVPIMRNDIFSGAFEVYYDISGMVRKLDNAMVVSSAIPLAATLSFLALIVAVTLRLDKKILEIIEHRRTEEELIRVSTKLEQSNRELHSIQADRLQMQQLMQNLIGNALKFHKKGEPPHVKISGSFINKSKNGHKNKNSHSREKRYEITVEDRGIGFDEKHSERIFGTFQRLHGRSEYEGSGIGLSVCRKITERLNGNIIAKSSPGMGAKFTVTVPAEQIQGGNE